MALLPGTRLGSYEIVAQIGAGGMGEVYKARDPKLDRFVAIKILPHAMGEDADLLARFEREAKAVAALSHPNVLGIFDFGKDGDITYAVMELLEGRPLRDLMQQGPLPAKQVVEIAQQIVQGLASAHAKGLVHRDIKPENIFITRDGLVKVLDFGLAKQIPTDAAPAPGTRAMDRPTVAISAAAAGLTEVGTVMGTAGYMSPEQVRGEPVDHRSDIFAVGVVLYEMLSGRRAFGGATVADTLRSVLQDEPPALSALQPGMPPSLERTVFHCLEKSPGDRFQTLKDLAYDLAASSGSAPVALGSGTLPRRSWGLKAAITLAALLVAAVGLLLFRPAFLKGGLAAQDTGSQTPSIAVLPFTDMSQAKDQEYFSDGLSEELLNLLAKIPNLRVVARTSSFSFKGKNADVATIAKALNVATILEGSIRKSGDRVRITAQLIRVSDSSHLWSETYDRKLTDLFAVQDEIANAVVDALKLKLLPANRPGSDRHHVPTPEAYDAYLLGRRLLAGPPSGFAAARDAFRRAVALDPAYAAAYADLAMAENFASQLNQDPGVRAEGHQRARTAVARAIALDPGLGDAYATRGFLGYTVDWDWTSAEADLTKAQALDPKDSRTPLKLGLLLAVQGRLPEGIAAVRRACELEPMFSPPWEQLGRFEMSRGDFKAARQALNRALALSPENWNTQVNLALITLLEGRPAAAKAEFSALKEEGARLWGLALAEHALGDERASREALDRLEGISSTAPYRVAQVRAWRGEPDQAFTLLEKTLAVRSPSMIRIKTDPLFANLRQDPRFASLVRRMGLPP